MENEFQERLITKLRRLTKIRIKAMLDSKIYENPPENVTLSKVKWTEKRDEFEEEVEQGR